jgi:outer membrane lipoprotein-sorting protein
MALALVVSAMLVAGCSGGNKAAPSSSAAGPTSSKPVVTTTGAGATSKSPTASSGSSVASLLGKMAGNVSLKYDSVTTGPGIPAVTQSIWLKSTKMRIEMTQQGTKMVILIDQAQRVMYNYMPDQNTAMKMDISQAPSSVAQDTTKVQDYNPVIVGTETFDGKLCTVIQFTNQAGTTKQWLWQERGFPVKIETTSAAGTTTTENRNISFGDIPDSTFQLPAGVDISEFTIPTGLPTNLPTGLPNLPK